MIIMTEKITYVAIDGREFENERECVDYENSLKLNNLCKSTIFLNQDFKIMNTNRLIPAEVFYIYVNNDDDKEFIDNFFASDWCSSPFSIYNGQDVDLSEYSGWFYYDSDEDEWKHFETEVQVYKNMENNFTKIMLDKDIKV